MYKLYTDAEKKFTCKVDVGGTSLTECKARIILETDSISLLFNGSINNNGMCEIPIHKLRDYLKENQSGNIKLEIIADNTMFHPWNDTFVVETKKKVSVTEINSNDETPSKKIVSENDIRVSVKVNDIVKENTNKLIATHSKLLSEQVRKRNVKTVDEFNAIVSTYFSILDKNKIKLSESVKNTIKRKLKKEIK